MRDLISRIIDLKKMYTSLIWLKNWATQKVESGCKGELLPYYEDREFSDCPQYDGIIYAIKVLRPDIARKNKTKGFIDINVALLAQVR